MSLDLSGGCLFEFCLSEVDLVDLLEGGKTLVKCCDCLLNGCAKLTFLNAGELFVSGKNNCYKLGMDSGLSFFVCDSIAHHEGYFAYDERRIAALLSVALSRISASGHRSHGTSHGRGLPWLRPAGR